LGVAVPVKTLWITGIRHNGVRRQEPPQIRIIKPGVVVVQVGFVVKFLTGEQMTDRSRATFLSGLTKGKIGNFFVIIAV